jgi:hypothetical protein
MGLRYYDAKHVLERTWLGRLHERRVCVRVAA